MTWLRSALGLSLVTKIGGFGLFLEPGGRPLGRLFDVSIPPSLGSSLLLSLSSSSLPVWFSFTDIPRSGFFRAKEPPDEGSIPARLACPVHH
ncbi:hypothetical protein HanXRQr2_Chr08g0341111 [Helianthus annuus]|uniref:Secreted protein n=1 Tax=Helianthus annuus TaxID=4232 RepID=A0A9K3NCT1_HELAN|nr:hypothetical protein HanXRQr2_Chr08g0341111 [Helianthus annuus]KAJ0547104.1 hypothetical protein HanIR_Chr08g0368371 [Helianthus annuus]